MYDVIIIGAGTAGLTAAIYSARAGKKVVVIEGSTIGGQIATSPRVENYPGIMQISGMEFSDRLFEQATALGVELEIDMVTGITDNDGIKTVITEYGSFEGKAVIIATGVKHRKLGVKGEEEYSGRGVSYCAICDGAFYRDKTVAVIGGGSSALISADLLSDGCEKVYLIHRRSEFRGEEKLLEGLRAKGNVEIVCDTVVDEIFGDGKVTGVTLRNVNTDDSRSLSLDGVFVSVGQTPENSAFSSLVKLDEYGYIVAGEDTKTSSEGIFAAGDCRTKAIRQLTTAAADGAVAALAVCDYLR